MCSLLTTYSQEGKGNMPEQQTIEQMFAELFDADEQDVINRAEADIRELLGIIDRADRCDLECKQFKGLLKDQLKKFAAIRKEFLEFKPSK